MADATQNRCASVGKGGGSGSGGEGEPASRGVSARNPPSEAGQTARVGQPAARQRRGTAGERRTEKGAAQAKGRGGRARPKGSEPVGG
eukprot:9208583-Lingulodinium_polyedra.AAC.1